VTVPSSGSGSPSVCSSEKMCATLKPETMHSFSESFDSWSAFQIEAVASGEWLEKTRERTELIWKTGSLEDQ
jgi:hypothetical protein